MSDVSINAIIAARLLKTGVEVLAVGINHGVDDSFSEDGWVRTRYTGVTTLTIKIYDPSHDEVK